MNAKVHLVYPHKRVNRAPDVIGWRVADHLSLENEVIAHDWDARYSIQPSPGDILIGHPHPLPGTVLRRSWKRQGWARRIVLAPFNGDVLQVAFEDPLIRTADEYCAITGKAWAESVPFGLLAHWGPAMTHVDLAIDTRDFPRVKERFGPSTLRKVLYVGHTSWTKNPDYLEAVAAAMPESEFGWIGASSRNLRGFKGHGWLDLNSSEGRELIGSYDIFLTLGKSDANPMALLEAMSWGLIPVATATSGYIDEPGIFNVPLHNVASVVSTLRRIQELSESQLIEIQASNFARLETHYNWDRLLAQIADCVNGDSRRTVRESPSWQVRWILRLASVISPYVLNMRAVRTLILGR